MGCCKGQLCLEHQRPCSLQALNQLHRKQFIQVLAAPEAIRCRDNRHLTLALHVQGSSLRARSRGRLRVPSMTLPCPVPPRTRLTSPMPRPWSRQESSMCWRVPTCPPRQQLSASSTRTMSSLLLARYASTKLTSVSGFYRNNGIFAPGKVTCTQAVVGWMSSCCHLHTPCGAGYIDSVNNEHANCVDYV